MPQCIERPIAEIPLYKDSLQCQLEPEKYGYIYRDTKTIRRHWREQHGWSTRKKGGGSVAERAKRVPKQFEKGAKSVQCQRFFPSRHGSNYFAVQQPEAATKEQARIDDSETVWKKIGEQGKQSLKRKRQEAQQTIQHGEKNEVDLWLKRTGWISYLEGCDREDLLQSIRQPDEDEDEDEDENADEEKQRVERMATVIWQAMGEVAAISQETAAASGVMLRLEAIRTEMHQTRYQPLQPYQEASSIKRRCQPWQQMLMFFVRTQCQHEWKSPPYRFSRRQFDAFERLIAAAENTTKDEAGESEVEEESEDGTESESDDPTPEDETTEPSAEPEPWKAIHTACLEFCIELLNQTIHNREYDMALVCALAVLGVDPFGGRFRNPETYPPILSSIIKVAHFMIIRQAEQIARPVEDDTFSPCGSPCDFGEDSGYESEERSPVRSQPRQKKRQRPHSSFEWVKRMIDDFMIRGSGSPAQWMLDLRTYGLKIHYNTTTVGHVNWKDGEVLEYKSLRFGMPEFRGMVHQLQQEARRRLLEDLLFAQRVEEVPMIPWHSMGDDPTNGQVGWSFTRDKRPGLPHDGESWLHERIRNNVLARERFIKAGSADGVDRERMSDWMRQVVAFRSQLLILMHMTGGQPARGTEILSVRHRNTVEGGHRNLFIEDGLVVFVTKYHKGFQMSGDVKIIHRYLPREVGELVVWYLWLVLPFVQQMEAMLWPQKGVSDHMWPTDVDGRKWTPERMKKELQRVSQAGLGQSIHMAAYREIAIAISRRWVRASTAFQVDEDDEDAEWRKQNVLSDAADEQATHSPHIAGTIYARDAMELSGATADRRQRFRAVSRDWHQFLGFESAQVKEEKVDLKRKRCPFEEEAHEGMVERRIRMREMDATTELQRMMRKEVALRSVQETAIRAIQDGVSPIVAVMPTGAGKSVLFMLPAFVEPGGVTIVVVVLKALRRDMIYRCEQTGIRVAIWDGRGQPDGASIVLVTPEKATSSEFGTFINRLRHTQQLDRVVIDECHVILNDQLDFRRHLQELGRLCFAETQMVLLTATLPPSEVHELFKRMYWMPEEVRLIRASTVRPNIRYSVIDGGRTRKERQATLERVVEKVLNDAANPQGKVVVMCESKPTVKEIVAAGLFVCEPFHADLSERQNEETLHEFRAGLVRVIVATGAFGMGMDIPDIRLVVHVDNPRSIKDYGQASGRAGRDGLPSKAVIIRGGLDFEDELVGQYMDASAKQCRRVILDRYLDGDQERWRC